MVGACGHMKDEWRKGMLSDKGSIPEFLLNSTKIHAGPTGRRSGDKRDSWHSFPLQM